MRIQVRKPFWYCLIAIFQIILSEESPAQISKTPLSISPDKTANYIHPVIQADRTVYSQYLVDRLKATTDLDATENWKEAKTLPLPAQFLSMAAERIRSKNLGLDYRLISLWPINPKNGPRTKQEKQGLQEAIENPGKPYTWIRKRGDRMEYNAVYSDKAVARRCGSCHNGHPKSSRKDFKLDDVMGGIQITFPINHDSNNEEDTGYHVPLEVVTDYIYSILEADRAIYTRHIVQRLEDEGVNYASEHWWEGNTLLLPAQFLLNASDLIKNQRLGLNYRLISLWPINSHNGASSEFERAGLEAVTIQSEEPYLGTRRVGNRNHFQAIYPDLAVTPSCVKCHNAHPQSPKHNFRLYDVMGGIAISIPLGQSADLVSFPGFGDEF